MSYSRKRKHSPPTKIDPSSDPKLFIQAHEADLVHGPEGKLAAQSLEVSGPNNIGSALIRLFGDEQEKSKFTRADDEDNPYGFATVSTARTVTDSGIWVDRYDARLLLDREEYDELRQQASTDTRASSPDGWSDLPSDTEDTFFFTPEEADDYRRDKRRRLLEQTREQRLKARMIEDGELDSAGADQEEPWGGSDEEPDEAQKEIMHRTAKHIATSPNPAQLELRILANHGSDKRFAFLRGRWSRAWQIEKAKARIETEKGKQKQNSALLGTLADYSSGDEDSDDSNEGAPVEHLAAAKGSIEGAEIPLPVEQVQSTPGDNPATIEARRARAKEWIAKRRAN